MHGSSTSEDDLEATYAYWRRYWATQRICRFDQPQHTQVVSEDYNSILALALAEEIAEFDFSHSHPHACDSVSSGSSGQIVRISDALQQSDVLSPAAIIEMGVTSLMFTGLPPHVTRQTLKDQMDARGFAQAYDYLHVPQGTRRGVRGPPTCKGYAFVNFLDSYMASHFCEVVYKTSCLGLAHDRVEVKAARLQGFNALASQVSNLGALNGLGAERLPFVSTDQRKCGGDGIAQRAQRRP
mmetsp:Transcript_22677/g.41735  ORF Transcript_22677/g.41735 Transcript_22677/m.41735 type:complete len:240 (-) Transcript_22677:204-923(-)